MPPHAVLLDLYDTLVDGDWMWWRARLSARLGIAEEALSDAFRRTRPQRNTGAYPDQAGDLAAVMEAAGVTADAVLLAELVREERTFSIEHVRPYPESMGVVAELRGRGIGLALVSNCSHNTRVVVEQLGLADAFDAVILSFEVGVAKPEPGIYEAALRAVGARPSGRPLRRRPGRVLRRRDRPRDRRSADPATWRRARRGRLARRRPASDREPERAARRRHAATYTDRITVKMQTAATIVAVCQTSW